MAVNSVFSAFCSLIAESGDQNIPSCWSNRVLIVTEVGKMTLSALAAILLRGIRGLDKDTVLSSVKKYKNVVIIRFNKAAHALYYLCAVVSIAQGGFIWYYKQTGTASPLLILLCAGSGAHLLQTLSSYFEWDTKHVKPLKDSETHVPKNTLRASIQSKEEESESSEDEHKPQAVHTSEDTWYQIRSELFRVLFPKASESSYFEWDTKHVKPLKDSETPVPKNTLSASIQSKEEESEGSEDEHKPLAVKILDTSEDTWYQRGSKLVRVIFSKVPVFGQLVIGTLVIGIVILQPCE